ncbi:MAG: hypothetical protein DRJ64_04665, partial [Thermoprotei archaeon]
MLRFLKDEEEQEGFSKRRFLWFYSKDRKQRKRKSEGNRGRDFWFYSKHTPVISFKEFTPVSAEDRKSESERKSKKRKKSSR